MVNQLQYVTRKRKNVVVSLDINGISKYKKALLIMFFSDNSFFVLQLNNIADMLFQDFQVQLLHFKWLSSTIFFVAFSLVLIESFRRNIMQYTYIVPFEMLIASNQIDLRHILTKLTYEFLSSPFNLDKCGRYVLHE